MKYLTGPFNSPANNEKYNDNYDSVFGKKCSRNPCLGTPLEGQDMCRRHLQDAGILEFEQPETD